MIEVPQQSKIEGTQQIPKTGSLGIGGPGVILSAATALLLSLFRAFINPRNYWPAAVLSDMAVECIYRPMTAWRSFGQPF